MHPSAPSRGVKGAVEPDDELVVVRVDEHGSNVGSVNFDVLCAGDSSLFFTYVT